jgi:hypothetical protein
VSEHQDKHSERARALLMKALDDELSSVEQVELKKMLAADGGLRAEWERLKAVKEVTGTMTFREPPKEVWDTYWVSVYNRAERSIGWLFLSLGLTVLFAWAGWHMVDAIFTETQIPGWIKLAIFGALLGGGILFWSVAREKWFARRHDRYKEVQR